MIVTIGILLAGFLFGLLLKGRVKLPTSAITMASICLLLFILGLEIGGNDELLGNLPTMGLTALIVPDQHRQQSRNDKSRLHGHKAYDRHGSRTAG